MMDEPKTPDPTAHSGTHGSAVAGSSVVLVRFKSRRPAERMVASLGRDFRKNAHKGKAAAFIVAHNQDGSFKLVQSRVLTSRGPAVSATKLTAGILTGLGLLQALSVFGGTRLRRTQDACTNRTLARRTSGSPSCSISSVRRRLAWCSTAWTPPPARSSPQRPASMSETTRSSPMSSWPSSTGWAANTTGCVPSLLNPPRG